MVRAFAAPTDACTYLAFTGLTMAKPGWWNAPDSVHFYKCIATEACPGGDENQLQPAQRRFGELGMHASSRRGELNSVEKGAPCKQGASGVLCGVCRDNYVLQSDGQCRKCNKNTDRVVLWLLSFLLFAIVCLGIAFCVWKGACQQQDATRGGTVIDVSTAESTTDIKSRLAAQWTAIQGLAGPVKIMIG